MTRLLFAIASMGVSFSSLCQSLDSKIATGYIAYESQDCEKAVKYLDQALAYPMHLKEKNIPKAYYYRAKARMCHALELAKRQDYAGLEEIEDFLLQSVDDFLLAKKHDNGKWGEKVETEMKMIHGQLLQAAIGYMNDKEYVVARTYCSKAIEIKPTDYIAHDLRGQCYYNEAGAMAEDQTEAKANFSKSVELYESHPPKNPDLLISYLYYRLALIERHTTEDLKKAMSYINSGQEKLKAIYGELVSAGLNTPNHDRQYADAASDLQSFELDLILADPSMPGVSLDKFDQAIVLDPNNALIKVAYASLLERDQPEKAIEMYNDAINVDPDNMIAYYNLGALFYNRGANYYRMANEVSDMSTYEEYVGYAKAEFLIALPHFELAHELSPNDIGILGALMQITIQLEDMDKYKMYKEKKEVLEN